MKNRIFVALALLLGFALWSNPALASNVLDTTMNNYKSAAENFGSQITTVAVRLLFALFGIQLTLNALKVLIKGDVTLEGLLGSLINSILSVGFFFLLIKSSSDYLPAIINSFVELGKRGSGLTTLTPSGIITQGIMIQNDIVSAFMKATGSDGGLIDSMKLLVPSMLLTILCVLVFICYVILAAQMALTLVQSYFWLAITPLLMGFGGLSYTKDIAITSLKGGLTIGMKMMCVYLIVGVAGELSPLFGEGMAQLTLTDWSPIFWCLATVGILAYLSFQVPKFAADLLNGTASLSAGDAASNMAMGAAALAGVAAGGASLAKGAAGAATSGAAGATGIAQALSAGMQAAGDLGKKGGEAALHSAGEVAKQGLGMGVSGIGSAMSKGGEAFSQKVADSAGGKIASNIQAGRGGSMSGAPSSSAPSSSSSPDSGSASKPAPKSDGPLDFKKMMADAEARALPNEQGSSSVGEAASQGGTGDAASSSSSSTSSASPSSNVQPSDLSAFRAGDASDASIGGGNSDGGDGQQRKPSLKDRIRDAGNHIPNDATTVGLNANLSHGGD